MADEEVQVNLEDGKIEEDRADLKSVGKEDGKEEIGIKNSDYQFYSLFTAP